jgi:effector-binding domain-containing protein
VSDTAAHPGEIREVAAEGGLTAVVALTTTWAEFPHQWSALLDEVWRTARASSAIDPGRNVMLYLDDRPAVEVGVETTRPFEPIGRVVCSELPRGRALTATHRGRYEDLGVTHAAVVAECGLRGLTCVGPRWEIYGHIRDDSPPEVEVGYLVG